MNDDDFPYQINDRIVGGRAGWTAHGTVTGIRDATEFAEGEERSVFVRWDGTRFTEDEMDLSEVQADSSPAPPGEPSGPGYLVLGRPVAGGGTLIDKFRQS